MRTYVLSWMSTVSGLVATIIIIGYITPLFLVIALPIVCLYIILQVELTY